MAGAATGCAGPSFLPAGQLDASSRVAAGPTRKHRTQLCPLLSPSGSGGGSCSQPVGRRVRAARLAYQERRDGRRGIELARNGARDTILEAGRLAVRLHIGNAGSLLHRGIYHGGILFSLLQNTSRPSLLHIHSLFIFQSLFASHHLFIASTGQIEQVFRDHQRATD